MTHETPPAEHETEKERVDRELIEFLNEVRVVLPGVQVLFASLLTLPFTGTFKTIDGAERTAYTIAFFATALAVALMITPSSFHRLRFRLRLGVCRSHLAVGAQARILTGKVARRNHGAGDPRVLVAEISDARQRLPGFIGGGEVSHSDRVVRRVVLYPHVRAGAQLLADDLGPLVGLRGAGRGHRLNRVAADLLLGAGRRRDQKHDGRGH